jgi:hypothetical protein
MLKKPCRYHKTPVNHTLEQCDMLNRFYGRAAAKDDEAKKDGVRATPAASSPWRTSSSSSGGRPSTCPAASASGSGTRFSPRRRHLLPRLVGGRHHFQPRGSSEPHPQPGPVPAGGRLSHRERAVLEGPDGRRQ